MVKSYVLQNVCYLLEYSVKVNMNDSLVPGPGSNLKGLYYWNV